MDINYFDIICAGYIYNLDVLPFVFKFMITQGKVLILFIYRNSLNTLVMHYHELIFAVLKKSFAPPHGRGTFT